MSKEPLYAIATSGAGRLKVQVGEIETPDGTVFDTTQPHSFPASKVMVDNLHTASQPQRRTTSKEVRLRRKLERQNRKTGRK